MKKERKSKKNTEEEMNLSKKEQEILDSYEEFDYDEEIKEIDTEKVEEKTKKKSKKSKNEEYIEEFEIIDEEDDYSNHTNKKNPFQRKINIFFTIIIVIICLVVIDVVSVTKYEKGPLFAIPVHKYKDGGSKEYIGLGYKVIKYDETNGKKGLEIGTWFMEYDNEPIKVDIIDLAIEFNNDEVETYNAYINKYLRVSGEVVSVSEKQSTITIAFNDTEGEKYTINMICNMDNKDDFKTLSTKQVVTVNGRMKKYNPRTKDKPGTIYLNNCSIFK